MTAERSAGGVLSRLRAVDWGDWTAAFEHARSRALLMREYLRRSAQWARHYGAESVWPFFDIAEHVDDSVCLSPDVASELDAFLRGGIGPYPVERTVAGAVRWAELRCQERTDLPDLPDPYEPLLALYERGGGFHVDQAIDLNGVSLPRWDLGTAIAAPPFLTTATATLDALDSGAKGRVTYFALVDEGFPRERPLGLMRRRVVGREPVTRDESFGRNLRWEPTDYFGLYARGHNDTDHVEIPEIEAAAFIDRVILRIGPSRSS
ncbi:MULTISPECIES: hypothetical protein [unclassified Streptomyces]|uniref:hypothetical protein n=1 Tax=unclassified Streptomyces TaxID=2593676 RepID=UPI00093A9F5C|nr:hypothetical protein [Streptomyces sp. CB02058]OKI95663.1 hypothetical protein AMK10_08145 [Streptomyces sp. CB02058]